MIVCYMSDSIDTFFISKLIITVTEPNFLNDCNKSINRKPNKTFDAPTNVGKRITLKKLTLYVRIFRNTQIIQVF